MPWCTYIFYDSFINHVLVDPNDLLDSKKTSREGEFIVKGGQNEVGSIEPFLRITHTCNVKKPVSFSFFCDR